MADGEGVRHYGLSPREPDTVVDRDLGPIEIAVPRARLNPWRARREWKSQALRAYQRRTLAGDALIASTSVAGTDTHRVRRALGALFWRCRTRTR